jgi:hypothetical protein
MEAEFREVAEIRISAWSEQMEIEGAERLSVTEK